MGVSNDADQRLPALNNAGHAAHCVRCLDGLPASLVEMDASRYISSSLLHFPFAFPFLFTFFFRFIFPRAEFQSRFIVWARWTSRAWRIRRYRRRIARAGKSGSGISMSVRKTPPSIPNRADSGLCPHFLLVLVAVLVLVLVVACVCVIVDGGFRPGPIVGGGSSASAGTGAGDTTQV